MDKLYKARQLTEMWLAGNKKKVAIEIFSLNSVDALTISFYVYENLDTSERINFRIFLSLQK